MKRLFLFALVATMLAACSKDAHNEAIDMPKPECRVLTVSFDDDNTRIQLNEETKTVWTKGDRVSVFYGTTTNEEWQFTGDTGVRTGEIRPVESSVVPSTTSNEIVVVYPYREENIYNSETREVDVLLPAEQTYIEDSYGLDGNILVWHGERKEVVLKSVCGWLKLQLTGNGEVVESITLRGNKGEQVAGNLRINTEDASATLLEEGTILNEVTLKCSEGIELGADATAFYIALPPMTFSDGFTVDVECNGSKPMTISTSKEVFIKRNTILPMATVKYEAEHSTSTGIPNNEIWYTATTKVEPYDTTVFNVEYISNVWDSETGKGVITFSGDVTTIGDYAFYRNKKAIRSDLTSITLPNSVTTIGLCAFEYCTNLQSINIPDGVTSIGGGAFSQCKSLTSIDIPDGVTTIKFYTFSNCDSLTSINIHDSITTIEYGAFYDCENLTSIDIPDSVTSLGYEAFLQCENLKSVTIGNGIETIEDATFKLCRGLTDLTIGNSVTTLGTQAFYDCESLTSVTLPSSVTTIGKSAFNACESLTSVNIPDDVTTIGRNAFEGCAFESITIPDKVTAIGSYAFEHNENLTIVTIGAGVTTIGSMAFFGCTNLKSVYCKPTTPPILEPEEYYTYSYIFSYFWSGKGWIPIGCTLYVPEDKGEDYRASWAEYAQYIVEDNF